MIKEEVNIIYILVSEYLIWSVLKIEVLEEHHNNSKFSKTAESQSN